MARAKKEGSYWNGKLAQPIYDGMIKYCNETGFEKTTVIEKALKMFIESQHGYDTLQDGTKKPKVTLEQYLQMDSNG